MNPEEVGRLLRERREELDMDIADVQQATKIRAKYIRAIEHGDTEGLPAPVYAKGFVRAIANTLGLDGFALMQEYLSPPGGAERAPTEETPKEPAEPETPRNGRRQRPLWVQSPAGPPVARPTQNRGFSAIILVVLVFVLLLGAGYAVNYYWLSELNNPAPTQPEAENPAGNPPDESTPPEEPPAEESSSPATPGEPVLTVETTRDELQNIMTFGLKATEGTLPDQLEVRVTASGRCWLRVTRETTGELLYEGTLSAGDEYTWTDPVGLRLRAGAPEALSLALNNVDIGTPVSVGAWTFIFRFGG